MGDRVDSTVDNTDSVDKVEHDTNLEQIDTSKPTHKTLNEIIKESKPNPWGSGMVKMYLCFALVYLGATMSGFDGALISSINALETFHKFYGLEGAVTGTGLMFSIFNIGQLVGALFIVVSDIWGRRVGVTIGCLGVIMSTAIMATAKNLGVFNASRFLMAFFTTIASASAPLLAIELAPPHMRARLSGLYNTLFYLGAILAAFSILGTKLHHEGDIQFKLPLWLQLACPGILLSGIFFVPESPRWLIAMGKYDKARDILVKYHANGDESHPIVEMEMIEISASLQNVGINNFKTLFNFKGFLVKKSDRYRLMLNVAISWFAQFSGNNVSSYYLPTLLTKVGVENSDTQILLNAMYNLTGWGAAAAGAFLHEHVGRRKMFIFSTSGMSVCMAMMAVTTWNFEQTGSDASSKACIFFVFLFGCLFAVGFTSMQPIYPGEVSSNKLRAKSMMIHQAVGSVGSFTNQFAAPIAMENISYWFYVFYALWDLVEMTFIYFFFVETKGRTLEELDVIFEAKNPRKASLLPASLVRDEGVV